MVLCVVLKSKERRISQWVGSQRRLLLPLLCANANVDVGASAENGWRNRAWISVGRLMTGSVV